jgi:uncharacterized integral membrane protein (TIGR00697 family)
MGAKTFPLLSLPWLKLNASVSIFVIPLIFTINDIVVEVYGKERARSIVRSSLVVILMFLGAAILFTSLPPSTRSQSNEAAYDAIFGLSIRFSIASLIAFILSDFLDIYIFSWIREKFGKKRLWLRNNVSNMLSQFIDAITFMTLAFYALDQSFFQNVSFIASLLIPYWLLRCLLSVLETPLVYWGVRWLGKEKEV